MRIHCPSIIRLCAPTLVDLPFVDSFIPRIQNAEAIHAARASVCVLYKVVFSMGRMRPNSALQTPVAGRRVLLPAIWLALSCCAAYAQAGQPGQIGKVSVQFADVSKPLSVAGDMATLGGDTTVTALGRTAQVDLARTGSILVCATTSLHLSQSNKSASQPPPLLLALDRGAIEVQMPATANDAIMTPDLRFQVIGAGPSSALDLKLRVARNGDTCVENAGNAAPTLSIAEQLGEATYQLQPGQHVMFEHGSLKEVVDHETSPCGCPPAAPTTVADTGVTSSTPAAPGEVVAANAKDMTHPFPIAVSEGLAAPPVPETSKPGEVQMQITMPLVYSGNGSGNASATPSTSTTGSSGGKQGAGTPAVASSTGRGNAVTRAGVSTSSSSSPNLPAKGVGNPSAEDKRAATAVATPTPKATARTPASPEPKTPHPLRAIGHFFKRIFRRG